MRGYLEAVGMGCYLTRKVGVEVQGLWPETTEQMQGKGGQSKNKQLSDLMPAELKTRGHV